LFSSFPKQFEGDAVVIPKESSWFGYYPDGASTPLLSPQQVKPSWSSPCHFFAWSSTTCF